MVFCLCFFFFQAEDGIRDDLVTGVQTCALPISCKMAVGAPPPLNGAFVEQQYMDFLDRPADPAGFSFWTATLNNGFARSGLIQSRSEERRVGEEGRSRWSPYHLKKKR